MPDPTAGAEAVDLPVNPPGGELLAVKPAAEPPSGTGGALAVGRRWHNYTIKAELPGPPAGCFLATDVGVMLDVVIQVCPGGAEDEARRNTWQALQELPLENFIRASEAREEAGLRYEIFPAPPEQSLRDWMAAHRANTAMIETLVQQLAQGLETMHQAGVVHLNLRPETIFIGEDDQRLKIMIGGLHKSQLTDQSGLVAIETNPYYAPPEAGGLFNHEAGDGLRAWDWWAVGRIVQEMVLGRHVYSLIMERDVRANPPELRARAEALLLERDPTALRAGAVELLPDETSPRLRLLLRGLLASVRDGRWRWPQVEAWLSGDQPPDRYELPRNTRLIRRGEQALTLTEIADLYSQPAYFAEGVGQLFPADSGTECVWRILQETPQFRAEFERVSALREMLAMPPWQGQPVGMCQAAVAGLVWLTLAAAGQRRPLCVGEYSLSVAGLRRLFREGPAAKAGAILAVFTAEPYLQRLTPLDASARKVLDTLAKTGREAVGLAKTRGRAFLDRPEGLAKLLEWVLASDTELQANREKLRARYAVCDDDQLDAWLRATMPARVELALLAATGDNPDEHGFIPHEAWNRRRHGELTTRGMQVSQALFWCRLERLIACSPLMLGSWPLTLAIWLLPLALVLMAQAWPIAALAALVAVVARMAGTLAVRRVVARYAPGCPPWRWTDQSIRCRRQRLAVLPGEEDVSLGKLEVEMNRIRQELGRLALPAGIAQPGKVPRLRAMWVGAALATLGPVVLLALAVVPPGTVFGRAAPGTAGSVATGRSPEPTPLIEEIGPDGKIGLYEIVNDGFGGYRRGPLQRWDVPKPAKPTALRIASQTTASGAERAFAAVSAELLLEPYPRQSRTVVVAVAVPRTGDARPSIVLYDSATGRLTDGWSYLVGSDLTPSTWYSLTGRDVVYLGHPEVLQGEDLIPLP